MISGSCTKGPTDVTNEIKEANGVFMTAVSSADINTLTGLYTSDAKLFPANSEVVEGPEAITGFWTAVMKMGIKKVNFETVTAQRVGDIAVEEGKYTLYVEGDHIADQGKYLVTWKREDGKWKVQRDIWNISTPAPQQRASANDTVMVVLNYVKADKVAQFEDFNINYLAAAAAEFNPQTKRTVRMQKPIGKNGDGTYTYIYIMDPFTGTNNYDMYANLLAKYGEEKASEYMKTYAECLKGGTSHPFVSVETAW
jgi:uncharacterized protein (TIGR02246 family)